MGWWRGSQIILRDLVGGHYLICCTFIYSTSHFEATERIDCERTTHISRVLGIDDKRISNVMWGAEQLGRASGADDVRLRGL
jgi:hypothetical protein